MKRTVSTFLFLCLFATSNIGLSQELPTLPDDPRVKAGKLANGISYVVIKNSAQPGKADFCLAERVGTSLESEGTIGSFELLQMLAEEGTRNFRGTSLTDYLNKIGVGREDIKIITGKDEITYVLRDVPIERSTTIDSSLLILYDWMTSINIDDADLAEDYPVLQNQILAGWDVRRRLYAEEINELYPDSPYVNMLTPDNSGSLNNITSKELRPFYYAWCRPDLQGVIVVGDVDPEKIETQIKNTFSTIPKIHRPKKRTYYTPQQFKGVRVVLLKDKEQPRCEVSVNFLKEPLKEAYRKSNLPYIQECLDETLLGMLTDRILDDASREDVPICDLSVGKGRFLKMASPQAYTIEFETLPTTVYTALAFLGTELDQIRRYGFTKGEFSSAIDLYWNDLEEFYLGREWHDNSVYLRRAVENFYGGYSLASTEMKYEIMRMVVPTLSVDDINTYASDIFTTDSNVVITCKMPDVDGIPEINKERVLSSFTNVIGRVQSSQGAQLPKWPQVVPTEVSTIISETQEASGDYSLIVLSNGATIIFKNTESSKDTISFKAVSRGGYSLMSGVNEGNKKFYNDILNLGGAGPLTETNMLRLCKKYNLSLRGAINGNTEELYGWALKASAEKLFQAIYLNMAERGSASGAFQQYKKRMEYDRLYETASLRKSFYDTVKFYNNSNKAFIAPITKEQIERLDYADLSKKLNARFSNAADFIFIFTGRDVDSYKDLAVKYIGGIPGDPSQIENWQILPFYSTKGRIDKSILVNMEAPRTYTSITLSCAVQPNVKNEVLSDMLLRYIDKNCIERISSYSSKHEITGSAEYYPEKLFVLSSYFETDSASALNIKEDLLSTLGSAASKEITTAQFNSLKKEVEKEHKYKSQRNSYWVNALELKYIADIDIFSDYGETLQKTTREEFAQFAQDLLAGNSIIITMCGTQVDIPTVRLLQEDEFIRNYFDIE